VLTQKGKLVAYCEVQRESERRDSRCDDEESELVVEVEEFVHLLVDLEVIIGRIGRVTHDSFSWCAAVYANKKA
jgi:hypothetical protein